MGPVCKRAMPSLVAPQCSRGLFWRIERSENGGGLNERAISGSLPTIIPAPPRVDGR